jgi:hypothetical protein
MFLRIAENSNINTAMNNEFKSDNPLKVILSPIPPFLEGIKCDCGIPATILINDNIYKCNNCTKYIIPITKLHQNSDTTLPITIQTIKRMKFEWSTTEEKWYTLYGNRIETKHWDVLINNIKNMIFNKKIIEINGEYSQDPPRKMTIY